MNAPSWPPADTNDWPPWCGHCDRYDRMIQRDDGLIRCPRCHPHPLGGA